MLAAYEDKDGKPVLNKIYCATGAMFPIEGKQVPLDKISKPVTGWKMDGYISHYDGEDYVLKRRVMQVQDEFNPHGIEDNRWVETERIS